MPNSVPKITMKRRLDYCRMVMTTSVVWFMLVVFVLLYFLERNRELPVKIVSDRKSFTDDQQHLNQNRFEFPLPKEIDPSQDQAEILHTRRTDTGRYEGFLEKLMRGIY